jgi:hypothetical protein
MVVERYFIICLPPLVLLAAIGLSRVRQRWLLAASLTVLIVMSGISLSRWYADYDKENWRGAAAYVLSQAEPGDAVVFYAYFVRHAFEHYLDKYKAPSGSLDLLELASEPYSPFGGGRQPDPDLALIEGLPAQYHRLWLVLSHDQFGHLERNVQSQLIQQSLQRAYAVSHERDFAMIRVLLYERRPFENH